MAGVLLAAQCGIERLDASCLRDRVCRAAERGRGCLPDWPTRCLLPVGRDCEQAAEQDLEAKFEALVVVACGQLLG